MKMIAGLLEPTVGEILFDGRPLQEDVIGYKRRMGYVPEEPFHNHLLFGPGISDDGGATARPSRDNRPSASAGCSNDSHCIMIGMLDRGLFKRYVSEAADRAALLHNPDLVLLDEPFSGLDVVHPWCSEA